MTDDITRRDALDPFEGKSYVDKIIERGERAAAEALQQPRADLQAPQVDVEGLVEAVDDYLVREISGLAVGAARNRMAQALAKHKKTGAKR